MEIVSYKSNAIKDGDLYASVVIDILGKLSHLIFDYISRDENIVIDSIVERGDFLCACSK